MYQPRPSDIALPPTLAIDLSRLVRVAVAAVPSAAAEQADDSQRAIQ